ncbi:MAG: NAD(P)-dependent oxidoreductase [Balneolales bacterium]|nr:NAD(P)-dependent oxidoreductase [Balneolales bacterium]
MRIIVTGARGFIGRHLVNSLEAQKIEYFTVGREIETRTPNHIAFDLLQSSDFSYLFKDLQATHIIHLAWYTQHAKYWNSPLNVDWASVTYKLINSFYDHGGEHAVIAGTCAEYDWNHGYCIEGITPLRPKTLYGVAKDVTRRYSEIVKNEKLKSLTWARVFFPYASDEMKSRLIPSLFGVFDGNLTPFGVNAKSYRDFLHADDVANALTLCATQKVDDTINISSGDPISIEWVVNYIASLYNSDPNIILNNRSTRLGEPHLLVGDNKKLKALGWSPKISLEQGLLTYLNK